MKELCDQLDAKIAALEEVRRTVMARLEEGGTGERVKLNATALAQIQDSLAHTRDARAAAESSCCSYTCNINYD
jgi:hypothetical protein